MASYAVGGFGLFTKPALALAVADVNAVVDAQLPESDTLEFKQQLPAKHGIDPWERGENSVGDRARNELLEESVAFANAHVGHLLLGIRESNDHPKRAAGVLPLPRCAELADRLRSMARDCVEPALPALEIIPVVTCADGAGVIVFRVGESPNAPHRTTTTRTCTIRRADRCEPMTMREIQDLTLDRARGGAAVDAMFAARQDTFAKWILGAMNRYGKFGYYGARATAIPRTPLRLPRPALAVNRPGIVGGSNS